MADNTTFQSSTPATPPAGLVVAGDDVGGVLYQRIKVDIGPDGTAIALAWGGTGMPLGTLPGGSVGVVGTAQALGTFQPLAGSVHLASSLPGTVQVLGTFQPHGTTQALGTFQPLAGSVHLASGLPGTVQSLGTYQAHGTTQALGTYQPLAGSVHLASGLPGTVQGLGTYQIHGTAQVLGSISVQGHVAHGAVAAGNPVALAGFGSSGTPTAVDDQDAVRLWADLNGRLHIRGTIDSMPVVTGTVQAHGTSQVLGTVRIVDPAAVTQSGAWSVAVTGTVQTHGTSQALGTFQSHGTNQALGTYQPLAGSVHLASSLPGTVQVLGSIQAHGTTQALGTVQTHGTSQALGTFQPLAGSVHPAAALPGTSQISGTVRGLAPLYLGEGVLGSLFTAAVTNGTLVPAPAQGTYVRLWNLLISGSAAGTAWLELGDGTLGPGIFAATNGGLSQNYARGVRTPGTSKDVLFNASAGSWFVQVDYTLET